MSRKSAKVNLRAEKALSALRGGSFGIVVFATVLSLGVGGVKASDCNFGWDKDIGQPGTEVLKKILAYTWYNDGNGLKLYAGGTFHTAGGNTADLLARWNGGSNWSSVAGEFQFSAQSPQVGALTTWFNPVRNNEELYFGGQFGYMDDESNVMNHIAAYDGTNVYPISDGGTIGVAGNDLFVNAIVVFQGDLYAAGSFQTAGNTVANNIARWDGTTWHALTDADTGVSGINPGGRVYSMLNFSDLSGNFLYVGGAFSFAGGQSVADIAKWDGTNWSSVGAGLLGGVNVLHAHKIGTQQSLYAGGGFILPGGEGNIARLDSGSWVPVGGGFSNTVRALASFEEGNVCGQASQLFAGGNFGQFWDGQSWVNAYSLAKWDGTQWAPLLAEGFENNNGVDDTVHALISGANDDRPMEYSLYVGGDFDNVYENGQSVTAGCTGEWSCTRCIWDLDGDGQINPVDSGLVQAEFGCPVGTGDEDCDAADIDGDCQVNPVDSGIVQARFGTFCP